MAQPAEPKKTPPVALTAPPAYPPVEPGMYEPVYTGPGQYAEPAPLPPAGPPPVEPGMYTPAYTEPGRDAWNLIPEVGPGMYEPTYIQPGYYAPRNASTYYGGPIWPPVFTGTDVVTGGAYTPGPKRDTVQTTTPGSGGPPTHRPIPSLGTATVLQPIPPAATDDPVMPGATSIGDILGAMSGGQGSAPPTPAITLGPSAASLGYRHQQGDPRVTVNAEGRVVLTPEHATFYDRLRGLFGGR